MKRIFLVALLMFLPLSSHAVSWELQTLDGKKKQLEDYKGKWVVVNFWATWCPPCREEIPELSSFYDNNKDKAVVLGVNFENVSHKKLAKFIDDYFMEYPQFTAKPSRTTPIGSVPGLPTSYVITPEGEVVARQVGAINEKMLTEFINNWKKE